MSFQHQTNRTVSSWNTLQVWRPRAWKRHSHNFLTSTARSPTASLDMNNPRQRSIISAATTAQRKKRTTEIHGRVPWIWQNASSASKRQCSPAWSGRVAVGPLRRSKNLIWCSAPQVSHGGCRFLLDENVQNGTSVLETLHFPCGHVLLIEAEKWLATSDAPTNAQSSQNSIYIAVISFGGDGGGKWSGLLHDALAGDGSKISSSRAASPCEQKCSQERCVWCQGLNPIRCSSRPMHSTCSQCTSVSQLCPSSLFSGRSGRTLPCVMVTSCDTLFPLLTFYLRVVDQSFS